MMQVMKAAADAQEVGEVELLFSFLHGWDRAHGGPRAGEAVRVLGFEREHRFEIAYMVSYQHGAGHAAMALRRLKACYGHLFALDVQPEARAFHEHLVKKGLLDGYELTVPRAIAA